MQKRGGRGWVTGLGSDNALDILEVEFGSHCIQKIVLWIFRILLRRKISLWRNHRIHENSRFFSCTLFRIILNKLP
jgi:hypothetical protein